MLNVKWLHTHSFLNINLEVMAALWHGNKYKVTYLKQPKGYHPFCAVEYVALAIRNFTDRLNWELD